MPEIEYGKPIGEMTNRELRAKVALKTDHRPPEHGLNKEILNSAHAWFTGDFYVKPAALKPGVPPKHELVDAVVMEAMNELHVTPEGEGDDAEDDDPGPLEEYYTDIRDADRDTPPRAMNKDELQAFVRAMESREDQRGWTA